MGNQQNKCNKKLPIYVSPSLHPKRGHRKNYVDGHITVYTRLACSCMLLFLPISHPFSPSFHYTCIIIFITAHPSKLDAYRTREVTSYSFDHACDISTEELKQSGIHSVVDVGSWLILILKTKFKQDELADRLHSFIQRDRVFYL